MHRVPDAPSPGEKQSSLLTPCRSYWCCAWLITDTYTVFSVILVVKLSPSTEIYCINLRFCQRYWWRSSVLRYYAEQAEAALCLDWSTLQIKARQSFETSVTVHQSMRCDIPQDHKLHLLLFAYCYFMSVVLTVCDWWWTVSSRSSGLPCHCLDH